MSTRVDLPESIFRRAAAKAAELGIPVEQFVTDAVEQKLGHERAPNGKRWMEVFGELSHLHEETERINRIIEEEFEQIEPEEWT